MTGLLGAAVGAAVGAGVEHHHDKRRKEDFVEDMGRRREVDFVEGMGRRSPLDPPLLYSDPSTRHRA